MKVNKETWFSSPVYYIDIGEKVNSTQLIKECRAIEKADEGRLISNRGGYQSNNITFDKQTELDNLRIIIESIAVDIFRDYGVKPEIRPTTDNAWLNINRYGDHNISHNHPGVAFSAVYYVKTHEGCGNFLIINDSMMNFFNATCTNVDTDMTYAQVTYEATEGRLLLFPAYLNHLVEPNMTRKDRISIAFNLGRL